MVPQPLATVTVMDNISRLYQGQSSSQPFYSPSAASASSSSTAASPATTSDTETAPLLAPSDDDESPASPPPPRSSLGLPSHYSRTSPAHHSVHLPTSFREKKISPSSWWFVARRLFVRVVAPLSLFFFALYLFAIVSGKVSSPYPASKASQGTSPKAAGAAVLATDAHAPMLLEKKWQWAANTSVVVTWVNGSDPVYRRIREAFGGKAAVGGSRDRDNEDLRYSLRTLTANMAWHTGEIIIVSPSAPTWLNQSHPRVRWVNQDDMLYDEAKPTFNSNNIEAALHRIKGLTDRIIVFNDDTFLNKPVHPSWFFTEDRGPKLFLERSPIGEPKKANAVWALSVWNTARILMDKFPVELENERPRFLKHAPFVYSVPILRSLHDKKLFASAYARTATHPFRNKDDVITPLLHHYTLIAQTKRAAAAAAAGGARPSIAPVDGHAYAIPPLAEQSKMVLLQWGPKPEANLENLDKLRAKGPVIVTINDAIGSDKTREGRIASEQLRSIYHKYFGGLPAPFEKATPKA